MDWTILDETVDVNDVCRGDHVAVFLKRSKTAVFMGYVVDIDDVLGKFGVLALREDDGRITRFGTKDIIIHRTRVKRDSQVNPMTREVKIGFDDVRVGDRVRVLYTTRDTPVQSIDSVYGIVTMVGENIIYLGRSHFAVRISAILSIYRIEEVPDARVAKPGLIYGCLFCDSPMDITPGGICCPKCKYSPPDYLAESAGYDFAIAMQAKAHNDVYKKLYPQESADDDHIPFDQITTGMRVKVESDLGTIIGYVREIGSEDTPDGGLSKYIDVQEEHSYGLGHARYRIHEAVYGSNVFYAGPTEAPPEEDQTKTYHDSRIE